MLDFPLSVEQLGRVGSETRRREGKEEGSLVLVREQEAGGELSG